MCIRDSAVAVATAAARAETGGQTRGAEAESAPRREAVVETRTTAARGFFFSGALGFAAGVLRFAGFAEGFADGFADGFAAGL